MGNDKKIWYCQECNSHVAYVQVSNFNTYLRCAEHRIKGIAFYKDGPITEFSNYMEEYSRNVDNRDVRRYKFGVDAKYNGPRY